MKKYLQIATLSLLTAHTASAALLFSDNFTVPNGFNGNQDVNIDLAAGRLGGSLAAGLITAGEAYTGGNVHHQLGNDGTFVGQPGGITDGNHVLLAFDGSFQSKIDIAALANATNTPIVISFDMYRSGNPNGGDPDHWGAFTLRGAAGDFDNGWVIPSPGGFGILARGNGGVQAFDNTGSPNQLAPAAWNSPGFVTADRWEITFTNTAGTGSAFNGTGSVVSFVNGSTSGTLNVGQLRSSDLQMGFRNYSNYFVGIDNITLSSIPEPSSMMLLSALSLGLLAVRRRK